jgi:hypothetical protein
MSKPLCASLAAALLLTGCGNGTYERALATAGGAACGIIGASVGSKSGRLIRGLAGAGACAVIGGALGRALDQRDQERASQATYAVLRQPLPPTYYRTAYFAPVAPAPSGSSFANPPRPERPSAKSKPTAPAERGTAGSGGGATEDPPAVAAAPSSPPPAAPGRMPGVPRAPAAQWVSDHSGASGSSTVISAEPATAEHGECRTVRETAKVSGQTISQDQRYCQDGDDWKLI